MPSASAAEQTLVSVSGRRAGAGGAAAIEYSRCLSSRAALACIVACCEKERGGREGGSSEGARPLTLDGQEGRAQPHPTRPTRARRAPDRAPDLASLPLDCRSPSSRPVSTTRACSTRLRVPQEDWQLALVTHATDGGGRNWPTPARKQGSMPDVSSPMGTSTQRRPDGAWCSPDYKVGMRRMGPGIQWSVGGREGVGVQGAGGVRGRREKGGKGKSKEDTTTGGRRSSRFTTSRRGRAWRRPPS